MTSSEKSDLLLAMPLLADKNVNVNAIIKRLRSRWGLRVENAEKGDGEHVVVMEIEGCMAAIAYMPGPLPEGEAESILPISYLWPEVEEQFPKHVAHVIVTLMPNDWPPLERYLLFTKMIESVLHETNSLGVYQGTQTLLILRDLYIDMANEMLDEDSLPFLLWVYIGRIQSEKTCSLYTYGMSGFGKLEMEIIDSEHDMSEMFDYMTNIGCYVIRNNVTFHTGETLGYTEEIAARVTVSQGVHLDGETIQFVFE